jgi:hypothetical protein
LPKDFELAQKVSKGHGRLEERTSTVSSQLNDFLDWPYPEQVFKLERRITTLKATKIQEQTITSHPTIFPEGSLRGRRAPEAISKTAYWRLLRLLWGLAMTSWRQFLQMLKQSVRWLEPL